MRRLLALTLALAAAALPGCGGDSGGEPLESALSYLPADAPFAVAIETDVDGDQYQRLGRMIEKFPLGEQLVQSLKRNLEEGDVDFEEDLKPLLGNPFVVGGVDARSFTDEREDDDFVGAIVTEDADKLEELVEKGGLKEKGEKSGAKLYEDDDGDLFGVDDDVLVVAGSRRLLEDALERSGSDDELKQDAFEEALEGLPEEALVRVYADVEGLLRSDPDAREATKVKWVAALRTLGLTAAAEPDGLRVRFRLATEGDLSEEDLPLAAGNEAPPVIERAGELAIGVRDPAQLADFGLAAGRALQPRQVEAGLRQLEQRLGIDVERDLLAQLKGNATLNIAPGGDFGLRAELRDPKRFEDTLAKAADELPEFAEGLVGGSVGLAKPKRGEDFYALAQPDGDSVVFGVVDDALVISNSPARAGRLGSESPRPVGGTKGAVALQADAERLAEAVLRQLGPQLGIAGALGGQLFTGPLGELIGSVSAGTDALEGDFKLEIE